MSDKNFFGSSSFYKVLFLSIFFLLALIIGFCYFSKSEKNMPIYVINLQRSPERMSFVKNQMRVSELSYRRFEAVDGYKLLFTDQLNKNEECNAADFRFGLSASTKPLKMKVACELYPDTSFIVEFPAIFSEMSKTLSLGELGDCYSHRAIWLDVIRNHYDMAIVFEDDVLIPEDFNENLSTVIKNIPQNADIIMLGWNSFNDQEGGYQEIISSIPGNDILGVYQGIRAVLGTHGYIVTKTGARKLLEATQTISDPIDVEMHKLRVKKELVCYFPYKKLVTVNDDGSIIAAMGRKY